ncbi:hypothetical protein M431DRAFT_514439 [Trichoderma harzianum CBS 226.95]|uniref:Uncharacterized protein n=1 Tax=Trichoderma harzianum CBS 226.95 TaxID=983964 RepID=A0A2T3ZR64_TRIHA|nr:hypothetical protein M431DRAFT_514439 [Trichoderma harzianum CBS 226.95]PTB47294.1 hypothetical protein M431DRAFT_514439 [Trichoderma harzianum CBS 226.95]
MAKVVRLRKQRKEWSKKAARAVSRGIDNLAELEQLEQKEREAEAALQAAITQSAEGSSEVVPASLESVDYLGMLSMDPELARSLGFDGVFPPAPLSS